MFLLYTLILYASDTQDSECRWDLRCPSHISHDRPPIVARNYNENKGLYVPLRTSGLLQSMGSSIRWWSRKCWRGVRCPSSSDKPESSTKRFAWAFDRLLAMSFNMLQCEPRICVRSSHLSQDNSVVIWNVNVYRRERRDREGRRDSRKGGRPSWRGRLWVLLKSHRKEETDLYIREARSRPGSAGLCSFHMFYPFEKKRFR